MTRILCNHCHHFFSKWKSLFLRGKYENLCPVCGGLRRHKSGERNDVLPPSEIIAAFMKRWGLTEEDLAYMMRAHLESVQKLLDGAIRINRQIAQRLEKVFKVEVGFWMRIEWNYQNFLVRGVRG